MDTQTGPAARYRDVDHSTFNTTNALAHASAQAAARRYEDFLIVDVDSHHYETESFAQICDYIEDPVLRHEARTQGLSRGGLNNGKGSFQELGGRIIRYPGRRKEQVPPAPHRDITLMRRWMDAMGVDIACMFPTPMLNLALVPREDIETALAWAYNRWLCETILSEDKRIRSMLYLPYHNGPECLKMVEAFADKPGVIGFMVTSTHYRAVQDNSYIKTYAALQERGLPLAFHSASGTGTEEGMRLLNRFMGVHALGFTWHNMLHMTNWLTNGMPERFPRLKVLWIESGLAWVPFLMQRLDNEWMMRNSDAPLLKRLPSDYMREMFYSTQPMEMVNNLEMLELTFKMMNAGTQLCYASDYPHWDMDLPSTIYDLPFLDEQAKRNILGGNAQRLFKLDPIFSDIKLQRRAARAATPGEGAAAAERRSIV
ncbi:MAG TPA: amidohydrolase family protein [Xanthobacteraceae bacterium]|jgi:predicted TIM-barrel fold metal-dependent hydrolase|nr:amidohydrolase family protein [Xanthobacteraceae bacterium]